MEWGITVVRAMINGEPFALWIGTLNNCSIHYEYMQDGFTPEECELGHPSEEKAKEAAQMQWI
jgi:hypothetical protein